MLFRSLQKLTAADLIDLQRFTEAWESYPATWSAAGTPPVLGNGQLLGRKLVAGKNRWNFIQLIPGSTTTFGTGLYTFSLSDTAWKSSIICGPMYIFDSGTANRSAICVIDSTRAQIFGVTSADTDVSATVPQTFVNGDNLSALVHYEVA